MKLVAKATTGSGEGIAVPDNLRDAIRRWYGGTGNRDDEMISVAMVQQARRHRQWLACDCRDSDTPPPLISPSLLTSAETYYLRRLVGGARSTHDRDCTFFRQQVMSAAPAILANTKPIDPAPGYFAVLKPEPEKLAQKPDEQLPNRKRIIAIPKLARMLWSLLDGAGVNRHVSSADLDAASITQQFARVMRAARLLEVAPKVSHDQVLHTHAGAFHSRRVFAQLRDAARRWPVAHAPQAFMLLYAHHIEGQAVHVASGDPVFLETEVMSPRTRLNPVAGPFLVLIVVGGHPDVHGYAAIRGYAQPILSARHFIPVATNSQRSVADALVTMVDKAAGQARQVSLTRPLFDFPTRHGLIRPDFIVESSDSMTGEARTSSVMVEETAPMPTRELSDALKLYAPLVITDAVAARSGKLIRRLQSVHSDRQNEHPDNGAVG